MGHAWTCCRARDAAGGHPTRLIPGAPRTPCVTIRVRLAPNRRNRCRDSAQWAHADPADAHRAGARAAERQPRASPPAAHVVGAEHRRPRASPAIRELDLDTHALALCAQQVLCTAPLVVALSAVLQRETGNNISVYIARFFGLQRRLRGRHRPPVRTDLGHDQHHDADLRPDRGRRVHDQRRRRAAAGLRADLDACRASPACGPTSASCCSRPRSRCSPSASCSPARSATRINRNVMPLGPWSGIVLPGPDDPALLLVGAVLAAQPAASRCAPCCPARSPWPCCPRSRCACRGRSCPGRSPGRCTPTAWSARCSCCRSG